MRKFRVGSLEREPEMRAGPPHKKERKMPAKKANKKSKGLRSGKKLEKQKPLDKPVVYLQVGMKDVYVTKP
jgi:hypothetical protein